MNKSQKRTKSLGEVFTPPELVDEILTKLNEYSPEAFKDPNHTFMDPACGDGEFLIAIKQRLLKNLYPSILKTDLPLYQIIDLHILTNQIFGVDIMADNTCDTIYNLVSTTIDHLPDSNPERHLYNKDNKEIGPFNSPEESWKLHRAVYKDTFGSVVEIERDGVVDNAITFKYRRWFELFGVEMEKKTDWFECRNIVCADALKYNFQFGRVHNEEEIKKEPEKGKKPRKKTMVVKAGLVD